MGGKGSGGRRIGAGRKRKSALERAIGGNAGRRGVLLQHPSSTAVAPVEPFEPPEALFLMAGPPIRDDQGFVVAAGPRVVNTEALAVWHELAPCAFEARTLTPATTAAFVMLCRAVVVERAHEVPDADHRGLMQRINTWLKDFGLAPFGKPLYAAQPETVVNPLDRFTKGPA